MRSLDNYFSALLYSLHDKKLLTYGARPMIWGHRHRCLTPTWTQDVGLVNCQKSRHEGTAKYANFFWIYAHL